MKNSLIISVIINTILVGFIYYNQLDLKKTQNKFQILQGEIDSLSSIIHEKDTEICNLHTMETYYQEQISNSQNELKNLNNKSKKIQKEHEAKINSLNNLNNSDVSKLFTEEFE
jgi:predicted  nucleic acid-binding Zn-ribbon protein